MDDKKENILLSLSRERANEGQLGAQLYMAQAYLNGDGVDQDYVESAYWMEKAANQGHEGACHNVAIFYENGLGVEKDMHKAIKWYRRAARKGFSNSQRALGRIYKDSNRKEAVKWLKMAANQNDEQAITMLKEIEGA
ncbi:MAG: sel1 repeat family protein [Erysipelotrichaceae bacterium]|nr:sel1 repeat family protein [Erysipelotrichaceae bacterium]